MSDLLDAVDVVCGECICIDEDRCITCPVRITLNRLKGIYYDVVASVYNAQDHRVDADLLHGGFENLEDAYRVRHEYKMATVSTPPYPSTYHTSIEIEVHDHNGALLEIIP